MASFDGRAYLATFHDWESRLHQAAAGDFSLDRMQRLLDVFGRPDDKLRFAHVAGTKGKGSTCAFLASILRAAGYRTGLYTSPHVHDVNERIRILEAAGTPSAGEGAIPWQDFEEILRYHQVGIERLRGDGITFYELVTALAAYYFASQRTDIVVLETGLGGRLDATNVFDTCVCGITPVGFDHMHILGDTLTAIAGEKAGIIKSPCQRVACAPQPAEALSVIHRRCAGFGIYPTVIGQGMPCLIHKVSDKGIVFDVDGRRRYDGLCSPLTGAHQAQNAALAIAMAEDLEMFGYVIDTQAVRKGVADVVWPGRFEIAGTRVVDFAHTPESARALVQTFEAVYPGRKAVVVLGMSADKDVNSFLRILAPLVQAVILTKADHPRAMNIPVADAGDALPGVEIMSIPEVGAAVDKAGMMTGKDGIILVTGSVFVGAQARQHWGK